MSLTLCDHAGLPDAHCRCPKCIAYFTDMAAVIVSLPETLAAKFRKEAKAEYAIADEHRRLADEADLKGLDLEQRAYELEEW